jgi:hypothetical protein
MARRMIGGNKAAFAITVLYVLGAMAISVYFYLYPIDAAGKEIAYWSMIIFGTTIFAYFFFQLFGKYIEDD